MMHGNDKGELRRYGYILILAYVKYLHILLSLYVTLEILCFRLSF